MKFILGLIIFTILVGPLGANAEESCDVEGSVGLEALSAQEEARILRLAEEAEVSRVQDYMHKIFKEKFLAYARRAQADNLITGSCIQQLKWNIYDRRRSGEHLVDRPRWLSAEAELDECVLGQGNRLLGMNTGALRPAFLRYARARCDYLMAVNSFAHSLGVHVQEGTSFYREGSKPHQLWDRLQNGHHQGNMACRIVRDSSGRPSYETDERGGQYNCFTLGQSVEVACEHARARE